MTERALILARLRPSSTSTFLLQDMDTDSWEYESTSKQIRFGSDHWLDIYDPASPRVQLWPKQTSSRNQKFILSNEGYIMSSTFDPPRRLLYNTSSNQLNFQSGSPIVFSSHHEETKEEKKELLSSLIFPESFQLNGTVFRRIPIRLDSEHEWSGPVYIATGGNFLAESSVFIFLIDSDYQFLMQPHITHKGAFGSDHQLLSETTHSILPNVLHNLSSKWYVVWKLPGDMFSKVTGIPKSIVEGIPVPVGTYGMYQDPWDGHTPTSHEAFPLGTPATKYRVATPLGRVHYLEYNGVRVPMITSMHWFNGYWSNKEYKQMNHIIQGLFSKHGIHAISCHQQHHALVFYSDQQGLLDPIRLANRLYSEPELRALLHRKWANLYYTYFRNSLKS